MCKNIFSKENKKYINGFIDIDLIPKDIYNSFIGSLKLQICEYYKNNNIKHPP